MQKVFVSILLAAVFAPTSVFSAEVRHSDHDFDAQMIRISPGSFNMGSDTGGEDEKPVHRVKIDYAFELGKTEVTQAMWIAIMGENPSHFNKCGGMCPVDNVSWDDVNSFIKQLNSKTGKNYRLPSEAEWEYACRAGGNADYCGGSDVNKVAWFIMNSDRVTHPVARKTPNAWGLYDMGGNVMEWVQDYYQSSYDNAPVNGSATDVEGQYRVLRGGAWINGLHHISVSTRSNEIPTKKTFLMGLRLARTLP